MHEWVDLLFENSCIRGNKKFNSWIRIKKIVNWFTLRSLLFLRVRCVKEITLALILRVLCVKTFYLSLVSKQPTHAI